MITITTGTTDEGCKFHERFINNTQILVQQNRFGIWFGYVKQNRSKQFKSEKIALKWLENYPLADVD